MCFILLLGNAKHKGHVSLLLVICNVYSITDIFKVNNKSKCYLLSVYNIFLTSTPKVIVFFGKENAIFSLQCIASLKISAIFM